MTDTQTTTNTQTDTTTSTNTTFVDQAPAHQEFGQQEPLNLPAPQVMPDEAWFAAKQLAKPVIVETLQWDSTQLFNTTLWTSLIPNLISNVDSLQRRTLQMYAFYRMNPVLRIQLNGTPFHQGQLVMGFVPFDIRVQDTPGLPGYFSVVGLTGFPSVQISAADAQSSELKIPFIHFYDYLMTNTINDITLGSVYLKILNPLKFSTGASPSLTVTISLYADSPEVHVPMFDHPVLYTTSLECEPTGLFSNVGAAVGHLTTGNLKGFFDSGSKAQKNVADLFDKPAYISTPQKTISPLSAMSHGKGTETTFRLGLDPSAQSVKPSEVFGVMDEMTMEHVIQTPMLFHQFEWTDMRASGDLLTSFTLNPRLSYQEETTPVPVFQPTYLAWMASAFSFWRGGFRIHADIISTHFHSGRMLIAFVPNVPGSAPTLQQAYSCPNVILDIKTTSKIDFVVPYLSNMPYKTTDNETVSRGIIGNIYIYVLNQLVHPDNVAPSIDVNLYISADKDFEFSVPRDFPLYFGPVIPASQETEPTGDVMNVQTTKTEESSCEVNLAYGTSLINRINRFGEMFPLVDYIKRYGFSDMFISASNGPVCPQINSENILVSERYTMSPVAVVAQIFAAWYGSLRYKILFDAPRTAENVVQISYQPNFSTDQANTGSPLHITNLAQDSGLEVEVPCYTPYNLLVSPSPVAAVTQNFVASGRLNMDQTVDEFLAPVGSFIAAGDDLRFFYMIPPPTVRGPLFRVLT
jgi:hypothetical protein